MVASRQGEWEGLLQIQLSVLGPQCEKGDGYKEQRTEDYTQTGGVSITAVRRQAGVLYRGPWASTTAVQRLAAGSPQTFEIMSSGLMTAESCKDFKGAM